MSWFAPDLFAIFCSEKLHCRLCHIVTVESSGKASRKITRMTLNWLMFTEVEQASHHAAAATESFEASVIIDPISIHDK